MIPAVKRTNLWNLIIFITWDLELSTQSRGNLTFPILQMPAVRLRVKKTPTPHPPPPVLGEDSGLLAL